MLSAATDTPPAGKVAARWRSALATPAGEARVGVGVGVAVGAGVGVGAVRVELVADVAAVLLNGLVVSPTRRVVPRAAITTTVTSAPTMSTAPRIAARRRRGA
jgi:hypothetical protein